MALLSELEMYTRFVVGLRRHLREPLSLEAAVETVKGLNAARESNFLRLLERSVYGYPDSPYLPLLHRAGCEMGDVRSMVRDRGLENTLRALREAGVYVTFEEFKGRKPIVRDKVEIPVTGCSFDNPFVKRRFVASTGGSTGRASTMAYDLDHLASAAAYEMLTYENHGVLRAPIALWRGILPDGAGIANLLRTAHFGNIAKHWFSPRGFHELDRSLLRFRIATQLTVLAGRFYGASLPWPEHVPVEEAVDIARWAHDAGRKAGSCVVVATVSGALRVCLAAREHGLDLSHTWFRVAGEPVTPAKVRGIEATGARLFTTYGFAESGRIGMGCADRVDPTDVHLAEGICALIQHERPVEGANLSVPAFNVTSLLSTTPKILLNTESDDYGVVETRRCGCSLDELGLHVHLREIRSFAKLTGEGVTLLGSDLVRLLEEFLPERFGGSPLDYQLMEAEDPSGLTKLKLLIHPRINIPPDCEVDKVVLEGLSRFGVSAWSASHTWAGTGAIRVLRQAPVWTERGKMMSLAPRSCH